MKFTADYRNVAIMSTLFRDHSQNSKKTEFFIVFSTFHRDPEMIPTTWKFPVNFTLKNYTSKLNFEKKNFSIPERGLRFGL